MIKLEGKIKNVIYSNDASSYVVAIFKVLKSSVENSEDVKKSITITGNFLDLKLDTNILLEGEYNFHDRFGKQFKVLNYEYVMPSEKDDIVDFLSSSFIKSCGKKTALKIVEVYGTESIEVIKKDKFALDKVPGINESKREKIYESIINYSRASDIILKLKNMGFSIEESGMIYSKYKDDIEDIINNNIYLLNDVIDFKRLDNLFLNNFEDVLDKRRVKACIVEVCKLISFSIGDTYYEEDYVYEHLSKIFKINISYELYLDYLDELSNDEVIVREGKRVYLESIYLNELLICENLKKIDSKKSDEYDYSEELKKLESKLNIEYNSDQENAIISSLNNNISIISGGPGTGKTTIINAIVKLYINRYKLNNLDISEQIALLAPTGRASKKMSLSTSLPASTIHRYLKWNKESNEFMVNEDNKNFQKLIIVDEVSMMDVNLFSALLKGLHSYVKLILVGDVFQLPSVGPGLVLKDLIDSDLFNFIPLNYIYRQSENSYIPYLARDIKNKELSEEFLSKKDDYTFLNVASNDILSTLESVINAGIKKGYDEENMQVLAPMYKGSVGIDNINSRLSLIFNPLRGNRTISYGDTLYKEGDKVLQLVNDTDNNVFNGDIGFIESIATIGGSRIKEVVTINFDGNRVMYEKKDLKNIRHAYAISIHKSQGSEFDRVIMLSSSNYGSMMYNKLLYTGVSRAKKSLIIIGDAKAFYKGVNNIYGEDRKTNLKEKLFNIFS